MRSRHRLAGVTAGLAAVVAAAPVFLAPTPAAHAGPGAPRSEEPGELGRIETLFDEWRFAEGRAALDILAKSEPDAPGTLYLAGYAAFLDGDYPAAVKQLEEAVGRAGGAPEPKALLALAEAARDAVAGHREERSAHFLLRYPPEDEVLAGYALDTLEAAYAALDADLGFHADRPVRVEIYRSRKKLAAVSTLTWDEVRQTGTIALCKWSRLMVTTPRAEVFGYPWLDTLAHELVHYAVSSLTRDRAPVWLQEGLAKFLERRWKEPPGQRLPPSMEHTLAHGLASGKLVTFEQMHPSMAKLPTADMAALAFAEVATAIEALWSKGGTAALRAVLGRVQGGQDARLAVAAAAGVTWPEFERGWRAYMAAQHYRTFPGMDARASRPHFRKEAAIASHQRPSEDEILSSILGRDAVRLVRLGNMLVRAGRTRAAAVEYDKAARTEGTGHWYIGVKRGRAFLALGEPDRALAAVERARMLYPELPGPALITGLAQLKRGRAEEAARALEDSLAINPFDPELHCALAEAYGHLPPGDPPPPARREREQTLCSKGE